MYSIWKSCVRAQDMEDAVRIFMRSAAAAARTHVPDGGATGAVAIYTLADPRDARTARYVGQTRDPRRRFAQQWLDTDADALVVERATVMRLLAQGAPLLNAEAYALSPQLSLL
jgi:hypothetical protein